MTPPLLEVRALTLRFGGLTAVDGVSFTVAPGEILAVIGPNGAGKTSLFNAITGIHPPTTGTVLIDGVPLIRPLDGRAVLSWLISGLAVGVLLAISCDLLGLWAAAIDDLYVYRHPFPWGRALVAVLARLAATPWPLGGALVGLALGVAGAWSVWRRSRRGPELAVARGLSRTFQNIRLFAELSVLDNVLVGMDAHLRCGSIAALLRLPAQRRETRLARDKAHELLAFVGLSSAAGSPAGSLSYGHQRRLEIARALAAGPRLLLLDEPAAGMNPTEADQLVELIRRIRERGMSVLLIEHHMRVVMGISDRILVLHYGRPIAEGSPAAVRGNPAVIDAYLGAAL